MTNPSPSCYSFHVPHHTFRHGFWRILAFELLPHPVPRPETL